MPRGITLLVLLAGISIAINLFLAGTFLGERFRGPAAPLTLEQRMDSAWDQLPEPDKAVAKQTYALHRDDILAKWRASRAAAQKAAKAMHAKTMIDAEIRSDFDESNSSVMDFRKAVQDMLLDVGGKISPEGRSRLRAGGGAF